jgi:hypothetical protein
MSFFRYNDPLQQLFGAMIAALIFLAMMHVPLQRCIGISLIATKKSLLKITA